MTNENASRASTEPDATLRELEPLEGAVVAAVDPAEEVVVLPAPAEVTWAAGTPESVPAAEAPTPAPFAVDPGVVVEFAPVANAWNAAKVLGPVVGALTDPTIPCSQ